MDPDRLGVYDHGGLSVDGRRALVRGLEERGVGTLWLNEPGLARDPLVDAAACAMMTDRLRLGIGLTNTWRTIPSAIAAQVATLERLAPERVTLGIGPWHEPMASENGVHRHHLLDAMRDATAIIRGVLGGEPVHHRGTVFSVAGATLGAPPPTTPIPLLWGVVRPRMVALAGAEADGVQVNYLHSPEQVADTIARARAGALDAGRDPGALSFPAAVMIRVSDEPGTLAAMCDFVNATPLLRFESGIAADHVVTPAELDDLVAVGSARHCAERIAAYLGAGATSVALVGRDPLGAVDAMLPYL
jgi:alkanesulfonate monooxygenase SsuD/methylene tetrahydromethanopterin reductase-like flavin-dependent oxidoreductase (luciferase family)